MSYVRACVVAVAVTAAIATVIPAPAQQKMPDGGLYTQYSIADGLNSLDWQTCGSIGQTEGCFGSGVIGPFAHVCSVVQSVPVPINLNTVLRYIYTLDSGSTSNGAALVVAKRTDVISFDHDTITVTNVAVVRLPELVGGPGVTCFLAQNPTFVYASTNQSTELANIKKSNYALNMTNAFNPITSITADSYGFVTVVNSANGIHSFAIIGPDGNSRGGGGGDPFLINPIDGVTPSNYPWP